MIIFVIANQKLHIGTNFRRDIGISLINHRFLIKITRI